MRDNNFSPKVIPLKAGLSRQFLLFLICIIIAIFSVIYLFSVPLIHQKVFEIERNSSHIALNNVFKIADRMYKNVEQFQTQALANHKKQLENTVTFSASFIRNGLKEAAFNGIPFKQARSEILAKLKNLSYGESSYVWVANSERELLFHPDPSLLGKSSLLLKNGQEDLAFNSAIKKQLKESEGFFEYKWDRGLTSKEQDKISYFKSYPEWDLIIGAAGWLEDVENDTNESKKIFLSELRDALKEIKIAKTGYLYVFDSSKYMHIHPNASLEGTVVDKLINPLSKGYIIDELIGAANTGKELQYLWDRPDEPGNYKYEKLSLVRYLPGFDWYIGSSVYLEELSSSANTLKKRLLTLAALTLIVSTFLALLFVKRVTRPLEQLANTALKVSRGDYTARSGINSPDEVGIMASSFDGMVEKLKENIDTLDIKVKKRTDDLLQANAQVQRMNAVGQLAGGLAHDFNNLLSIILGNLLLARDRYKSVPELDNFITPAIRASRRGADITHRLLSFSRRQPLHPTMILLDQLMSETTKLLSRSLPERISLNYIAESPSLKVFIDPSNLENILVNLAFNARDAISGNGELTYRTSLVTYQTNRHGYDETVPVGTYIKIVVQDTGEGFTEEALEKAYEPFYTTKAEQDSSGLGLSMVYGFVKQSNGFIRIRSIKNKGSCISILLPSITKEEDDNLEMYDTPDTLSHAGKLFLLVEDNDDVRKVVNEQLVQLGIKVIETKDLAEAEELIENIDTIDGMLTDYMLKGKKEGQRLAELLYFKNSKSIILLMSGYSYESEDIRSKELVFPLLQKPFDNDSLSHCIGLAVNKVQNENNDFEY